MEKTKIICSMGGGYTSTALMPKLLLQQYSKERVEFINCVLPNEHPDTWALFDAVEDKLGIEITYIAYHPEMGYQFVQKQDRSNKELLYTPFKIFLEQGFIGNSRNDPCSDSLKRKTIFNYVSQKYTPSQAVIAVGIHVDEYERSIAIRQNWEKRGYKTIFPILNEPKLTRQAEIETLKRDYGVMLDLYEKGFEHNNCGGACVKAGQRQWAMLWYYYPHVYQEWEQLELTWGEQWAEVRGKQYTILKMRRNKKTHYITLKEFRETVLEPAYMEEKDNIVGRLFKELPGNPACMWCSAI